MTQTKRLWLLVTVGVALQVLALLGLPWICFSGYGQSPTLSEGQVIPLTNLTLFLAGPVGLLASAVSVYLLLSRHRLRVAIPVVLLVCAPCVFLSSIWTHALGIFLCVI